MFIHFQLQWIGCNQTWHHDAAAPCNWITLRLLENCWTLQPGRMARHLDAMGCTRCYMANGARWRPKPTYATQDVLQCARQIWLRAGVSGVSATFSKADFLPADFFRSQHPILPSLSLRLAATRHSNLPDAACQLVMLVDSKDAAWSSLSSFTKPILRSAMQSGAYNSRRRNHLQHSES